MTLKEKVIKVRNENKSYRTLLGTVLGEFDRIPGTSPTNPPTNEQCVQVIKKMVESAYLIGTDEAKEEAFILDQFLPSQLSESDIKSIIDECQFESIKECMIFFKESYMGRYDGKLVSKLFNQK